MTEELHVLIGAAIAHHPLDDGARVPRAVEEHDLAGGGQVADPSLEIPLALLRLGGDTKCHDRRLPWVEMLHEPLDGPALARGVAPFEDDADLLAAVADPRLQ